MHFHVTKRPAVLLARGAIAFNVGMTIKVNPGMMLDDDGSLVFFVIDKPALRIGCSHDVFHHVIRAAGHLFKASGGFAGPVIAYNPIRPEHSLAIDKSVFDHVTETGLALIRLQRQARREKRMQALLRGRRTGFPVDAELQEMLVRDALDGLQCLLESSNEDMVPGQMAALLRLIHRPL